MVLLYESYAVSTFKHILEQLPFEIASKDNFLGSGVVGPGVPLSRCPEGAYYQVYIAQFCSILVAVVRLCGLLKMCCLISCCNKKYILKNLKDCLKIETQATQQFEAVKKILPSQSHASKALTESQRRYDAPRP